MANQTVGILHSGTRGSQHHTSHIQALIEGIASGAGGTSFVLYNGGIPLYAGGDTKKLAKHAAQLVAAVDVLVAAGGTASAQEAVKAAAGKNTKIIFTSVTDPVGSGLVPNLTPAGNVTGIRANTSENDVPRLQIIAKLPGIKTVGVLTNPYRTGFTGQWNNLTANAGGLALVRQDVDPSLATPINTAINTAFANFKATPVDAVLVTADPIFNDHRRAILATSDQIPAIYQWSEFVIAGGLMSYGPNITLAYSLAGVYAGRIINGAAVGTLPIISMTGTELFINLSTANALNITIPDTLLGSATEVIL